MPVDQRFHAAEVGASGPTERRRDASLSAAAIPSVFQCKLVLRDRLGTSPMYVVTTNYIVVFTNNRL